MKQTIPLVPFFFIRHGETDWNVKKMWQGWMDIPLNQTGHQQAQEAIAPLSGKGISRVVCSPLIRAYKTAEIINEHLAVPLIVNEKLKERSWGVLEGTTIDFDETAPIKDGEPVNDFKERIATALHDSLDPDHTTLVVAHGAVYSAIMEMIGYENERSHNCIPYLFTPPQGNQSSWTVQQLNSPDQPLIPHNKDQQAHL